MADARTTVGQLEFEFAHLAPSVSAALFDPTGAYRWCLWRVWSKAPTCLFVMCNPSTADGCTDDATIRRCRGFAQAWGFGGLKVVNLFAWRATNPRELACVADPVGSANNTHICTAADDAARIVVAWGALTRWAACTGRAAEVLELLAPQRRLLCMLGRTADGSPRHPLFMRADVVPVPFFP